MLQIERQDGFSLTLYARTGVIWSTFPQASNNIVRRACVHVHVYVYIIIMYEMTLPRTSVCLIVFRSYITTSSYIRLIYVKRAPLVDAAGCTAEVGFVPIIYINILREHVIIIILLLSLSLYAVCSRTPILRTIIIPRYYH